MFHIDPVLNPLICYTDCGHFSFSLCCAKYWKVVFVRSPPVAQLWHVFFLMNMIEMDCSKMLLLRCALKCVMLRKSCSDLRIALFTR
jgi:hypothetical protein